MNDTTSKHTQNAADIRITARWDHCRIPTGEPASRGLLIEIEAPKMERRGGRRPPVNLALVIDRSGSMHGAPLHCAIEAAVGVAGQLDEHDRLSVVAYDNHVDVLANAVLMDAAGRREVESVIRELHARG